jgi:superfamily II DNA/RNA helicase
VRVEVAKPATTVATTTQLLARSGREAHDKRETLRRLIRSAQGLKNAIIFCNRKRDVATLYRSLLRHGFSVQALHGDMDQPARMAALEQFRRGEVTLLVASDVAARGLDIPDVSHVYNFDVPMHPDDYVHRIGRTGRAGRSGTAVSIVAGANDAKAVAAIEKLIGSSIPFMDDYASAPQASAPQRQGAPQGTPQPRRQRPDGHRQAHRSNLVSARPRSSGDAAGDARLGGNERKSAPRPLAKGPPPKQRADDADTSHLPAFLLRPVPLKA